MAIKKPFNIILNHLIFYKIIQCYKSRTKSKIMDFSMLGVDSIVVDEAHNFKNLGVISPMSAKGKGANVSSKRALNFSSIKTSFSSFIRAKQRVIVL